jgi:hypothetical protein
LIVGDLPNPAIPAPIMDAPEVSIADIKLSEPPAYTKGQLLATREAYGSALVRMMLVSKFLLLFKNLEFYFDLLTSGLRLIKQS